jgi:hypothetical protein
MGRMPLARFGLTIPGEVVRAIWVLVPLVLPIRLTYVQLTALHDVDARRTSLCLAVAE